MDFINNEYETTPILHFLFRNNNYWVYHKNTVENDKIDTEPANKLWYIIKFYNSCQNADQGFKLEQGDTIKLGRVRFKIKEIHRGQFQPKEDNLESGVNSEAWNLLSKPTNRNSIVPQMNNYMSKPILEQNRDANANNDNQDHSVSVSKKSADQIQWRICLEYLDPNEEDANPIISPWNCSGTMKYIHTECLKLWLSSKGITNRRNEVDGAVSYIWKSLDWELCKTKFPDYVVVGDKKINLIDIEKPEGPYIILENVSNNGARAIHVLGMVGKDLVKIGRGHDSDVRIGDISVSRLHATIRRGSYNNFFIEDWNSKFGTLVHARFPVKVTDTPLWFQIGRSIFQLDVPSSWSIWNIFNWFKSYGNKSKAGLVTIDGKKYFPKEYLDSEIQNRFTVSEEWMSDYMRNINMINERQVSNLDSNQEMSYERNLVNEQDFNQLLNEIDQAEDDLIENQVQVIQESEQSRSRQINQEHSDLSVNNQSVEQPSNSWQDEGPEQDEIVENSESYKDENEINAQPSITNTQQIHMIKTFTQGFSRTNHLVEQACNLQDDNGNSSLFNHYKSSEDKPDANRKVAANIKINNMFEEISNHHGNEPVMSYQKYKGSVEMIKPYNDTNEANKNNINFNHLETNFSKSAENFKQTLNNDNKQNDINYESRRTYGFNLDNVRFDDYYTMSLGKTLFIARWLSKW